LERWVRDEQVLGWYGPNMFAAIGYDWRRHLPTAQMFRRPLTSKLQETNSYFTSFEQHVLEMVDERRALGAEGIDKGDLFSNLIRASDAEEGNARLNKIEMLSNIHIFMLAGHETTAHTCLACLT